VKKNKKVKTIILELTEEQARLTAFAIASCIAISREMGPLHHFDRDRMFRDSSTSQLIDVRCTLERVLKPTNEEKS
jgi:hypothetical protein